MLEFADQQKLSAEPLVAFSNDGTLTNVKVVRTQPGAVFGNDLKDTDYGGLPQEQSIEQRKKKKKEICWKKKNVEKEKLILFSFFFFCIF